MYVYTHVVALLLAVFLSACGGGGGSQEPTDSTPPTAARVVALVASNPDSVQLAWLASKDNQTAQSAIAYEIHKASTNSFKPDSNTIHASVTGVSEYTVKNLQPSTEYYLRIVSKDEAGNKTLSEAEHFVRTPATAATLVEGVLLEKAEDLNLGIPILKTDNEIRFRLEDSSEIPTVGAILVGQDQIQGGYLVKVIQVTTEGDEIVILAEQAAVSDALETADIHSEIKLFDNKAASTDNADKISVTNSVSATELHTSNIAWQSGILSVSHEEFVPYIGDPIASTEAETQVAARSVVDEDLIIELIAPAYKLFVAGERQSVEVFGQVLDETLGTQFVDIQLDGVTHQTDSPSDFFGITLTNQEGTESNQALIMWTPSIEQASPDPYKVLIKATPYARPDITVYAQIDIYVSEGQRRVISDENEEVSLSFDLAFEPTFVTDIKLSKIVKKVKSAEFYAQGNLDLHALAEYNFAADKSWDVLKPVIKFTYNSVYYAGPVPIYQRITFTLDAQLTAYAQSEITGSAKATANSFIKFGLRYTDEVGWQIITDQGFTKDIIMDLSVRGDITAELRLIPKAEVAFYEVAMGDLSLEPYTKGTLGAEYVAHADLLSLDAYNQYQMTECRADLGIDVYASATLDIWVKEIDFYPRTRLWNEEWPLYSLPELALSIDPSDSSLVIAKITDGINNTFNEKSINWSVYPSTATITQDLDDPTRARFISEAPDEYMVFFSGYSNLGPISRGYSSYIIDTGKDSDGDGMPDKWENLYTGLDPQDGSDGSDDEDSDGLTNLDEYLSGTDPNNADSDADAMPDGWEVNYDFNPNSDSDALEDADLDGISNLDEYLNGTNPQQLDVNLTATPEDGSVILVWNHLSNASAYTIYYAEQPGITPDNYTTLTGGARIDIAANFTDQASHSISGLANGTTYYFILSATVDAEETLPSAEVSATPSVDITLPPAPTGLVATPGDAEIHLSWEPVDGADSYNLYYATESFSGLTEIGNYGSLTGGTLLVNQSSPMILTELINGTQYFFVVTAVNSVGESPASIETSAIPAQQSTTATGPLNDTGITWGGDYPDGNNTTCIGETISQQDCSFGRDANDLTNSNDDGHAGFNFTKIDSNGDTLPADAADWSCIKDSVTGLIWETKLGGNGIIGDEGLHDADDGYNWYNTDPDTNGGDIGSADNNGPICYGYDISDPSTYCNTQDYVARVNAAGLCGATDWRMPNLMELVGLVNQNTVNPAIDVAYFSNTQDSVFWSSSPRAYGSTDAWGVHFSSGNSSYYNRDYVARVRLVRSSE